MGSRLAALAAVLPFLFVESALSASQNGAQLCQSSSRLVRSADEGSHTLKINVDSYLERAAARIAKGNFQLAITELDKATALSPSSALAYRMRGKAYRATGNNDQAIADFSKAIQLNHEAADYNNRGTAYQGKQDLDHALLDYNKAVELSPNDPVAYFLRSDVYEAKGFLDRAIADYDTVIRLEQKGPMAVVALTQRAGDYEIKGDFDRAITDYGAAMRLSPRDSTMEDNRANAYQAKGDFGHAIIDYDNAVRNNPQDSFAYRGRGLAYFLRGFLHQAYHDFKIASELDPEDAYAALWLDIAAYRTGKQGFLPKAMLHVDMSKWPSPAIRRFIGEITAQDLRSAAEDIDPSTRQDRICEADFYNGELALRNRSIQAATSFLRAAVNVPKTSSSGLRRTRS